MPTVLDGAHNPDGARALAESLPDFLAGRPLTVVVSILDDKDAAAMLAALTAARRARLICTAASSRGRCRRRRAGVAVGPARRRAAGRGRASDPGGRWRSLGAAGRRSSVLVTGSLYLIADLLRPAGAGPGSIL